MGFSISFPFRFFPSLVFFFVVFHLFDKPLDQTADDATLYHKLRSNAQERLHPQPPMKNKPDPYLNAEVDRIRRRCSRWATRNSSAFGPCRGVGGQSSIVVPTVRSIARSAHPLISNAKQL